MYTIFSGIISVILDSISLSSRKKALNITTLSKGLFKIYAQIIGFFILLILLSFFGIDYEIFTNYKYLLVIALTVFITVLNAYLHIHIVRKTKLSELLPYENLDKLFIVVLGFFLFFGTDKGVSFTTLMISILTLLIVLIFSIDLRNIKLPKTMKLFFIHKILKALKVLIVGFILVKYSSLTFAALNWLIEIIIYILILSITKDNLMNLTKQQKGFYINRTIASVTGRSSFIIGLFIIKEAGIIIATLLGFLGLVTNIIFMKFILKDSPSRKQITLAFSVIMLIGIGFYFK